MTAAEELRARAVLNEIDRKGFAVADPDDTDNAMKLAKARDHITPGQFQVLIADAKKGRSLPVEREALDASTTDPDVFRAGDGPPPHVAGLQSGAAIELTTPAARITKAGLLDALVTAARDLKAAEVAHREAQERYAAAVRALSEEAVK